METKSDTSCQTKKTRVKIYLKYEDLDTCETVYDGGILDFMLPDRVTMPEVTMRIEHSVPMIDEWVGRVPWPKRDYSHTSEKNGKQE